MMNIIDALKRTEIGPIIATHRIKWYRPDGVEDHVTIEIGEPVQGAFEGASSEHEHWACGIRCSLYTKVYNLSGKSSLGAVISAIRFAVTPLRQHPAAEQLADNVLPYFGLSVPQSVTPEEFTIEHTRPKRIRMPEVWRDEPGYQ